MPLLFLAVDDRIITIRDKIRIGIEFSFYDAGSIGCCPGPGAMAQDATFNKNL
ncbi:hypothetical protein [Niabella ginsenosidivorans]|uniref:hypothetical protein n=1 Tax=Niabella ginsenosidivorans TaxID=1176587 RepID=UPI0012EDFB81|nr:hypothetical protein [Niabella ginsenosidivorans]